MSSSFVWTNESCASESDVFDYVAEMIYDVMHWNDDDASDELCQRYVPFFAESSIGEKR